MTSDRCSTTEFQKRHGDLPHWEQPGAVYSIRFSTARTFERSIADAGLACILVAALHRDDGSRYELHAYVIMPDHVHVVLRPLRRGRGMVPLAEITDSLKGVTAHRINSTLGRRGKVWRDESYDRIIRDKREYHDTVVYIQANPVGADLVERAEQWPWTWPPLG